MQNILTLFPKTLKCKYLLEIQYFIILGPGKNEAPSVQLLNWEIVTERESYLPPYPSQLTFLPPALSYLIKE